MRFPEAGRLRSEETTSWADWLAATLASSMRVAFGGGARGAAAPAAMPALAVPSRSGSRCVSFVAAARRSCFIRRDELRLLNQAVVRRESRRGIGRRTRGERRRLCQTRCRCCGGGIRRGCRGSAFGLRVVPIGDRDLADAPAASTANRIVRLAKIAAKQSTRRTGALDCDVDRQRSVGCCALVEFCDGPRSQRCQWQAGKTLPVVAVVPEIRAAPVAQTLPAVTVDRSG